jgi:superfamily II DNA or RNA helicase
LDENRAEIEFKTEPRIGQNEVFVGIMDILAQTGGVTLQLNTGQGKTWIVSKIIWTYWQNTIIFVQNTELQNQMVQEIEQHTGISWICKIGGEAKTKDKKALEEYRSGCGFTPPFIAVAVYKSANNLYQKYGPEFWNSFYLSVYDECHCYCNPTGIPLLKYCQTPKKFALSATPDNGWNTKLVQLWCGMLYNGDSIMPKKNIQGQVKIIKYYGPKDLSESQKDSHGVNSFRDTLHLIEQDQYRIQLGIDEVFALHQKDLCPLVFFQHVEYMKDVQIAFEQKYGIQPAMLYGKTPKQDRVDIKQNANIIFTNYKFGSTGLNIQRVKSMLFFEPHKSLGQQVNGRAMRDSSETVRLYVDIVDMGSFLSGQIR